jgi:hypothetical protein
MNNIDKKPMIIFSTSPLSVDIIIIVPSSVNKIDINFKKVMYIGKNIFSNLCGCFITNLIRYIALSI